MSATRDVSAARTGPVSTFTSTIRLRLKVPARLRNLELVLLVVAVALTIGALALVQLGVLGELDYSVLIL